MPLVTAVRSTTSFSTFQVSFRLTTASRTAPPAPTPAASVGVVQPSTIEPSTRRIRNTVGMNPRISSSSNSPSVCGPISFGKGGASSGLRRQIEKI